MSFQAYSVCFADGTQHFAGISGGNHVGGNVFGHHAACPDDGSIADGYTGQQGDVGGNPYVVADSDGFCLHNSGVTLVGVLISNSKTQAVTDAKLEELTREVREHNNFARRVPVMEEQVKVINHRLNDLEERK